MPFFIVFSITLFLTIMTLITTRLLVRFSQVLAWIPGALSLIVALVLLFNAIGVEADLNLYLLFGIAFLITSLLNILYILIGFRKLNIK